MSSPSAARTIIHILRRRTRLLSAGFALLGFFAAILLLPPPLPPRTATSPQGTVAWLPLEPTLPQLAAGEKMLLLILDGVGGDAAETALADGTFHSLARLAAQGVWVPSLRATAPGAPAWTALTLATDADSPATLPELEAILTQPDSEAACTVWEAIAGRTSPLWAQGPATLLFWPPGLSSRCALSPEVRAISLVQDLPAGQHEISLVPAEGWESLPASYSPPRQGVLRITGPGGQERNRLYLLALDRRNDGRILYDHFLLDSDQDASEGAVLFRADAWADYPVLPGSGAAFRVLQVTQGRNPSVTLYHSAAYHLDGFSAGATENLSRYLGPPSPPPDLNAWEQGWLTGDQVVEMGLRQVTWLRRLAEYLHSEDEGPLLAVRWVPLEDTLQAIYRVSRDPAPQVRRLLRHLDRELGALLRSVDLTATSVVVLSGYGQTPMGRSVNLAALVQGVGESSTGDTPKMVTDGSTVWLGWPTAGEGAVPALQEQVRQVLPANLSAVQVMEAGPAAPQGTELLLVCQDGFGWASDPDQEAVLVPCDRCVAPGPGEGFLIAGGLGVRQGVWAGPWQVEEAGSFLRALLETVPPGSLSPGVRGALQPAGGSP